MNMCFRSVKLRICITDTIPLIEYIIVQFPGARPALIIIEREWLLSAGQQFAAVCSYQGRKPFGLHICRQRCYENRTIRRLLTEATVITRVTVRWGIHGGEFR